VQCIKNHIRIKFIDDFENTAVNLAIDKKYNYVICGHIHQPAYKEITTKKGQVTYLNSGDWIENLTALEYRLGEWVIYKYDEKDYINDTVKSEVESDIIDKSSKEIFGQLVTDILV